MAIAMNQSITFAMVSDNGLQLWP